MGLLATPENLYSRNKLILNFDIAHVVPPQSAPDFIKTSRDENNAMGYVE
jgi:hypothetical protein